MYNYKNAYTIHINAKSTATLQRYSATVKNIEVYLLYFTCTTRYLLVLQKACGSVMRSVNCLLASGCSL